MSGNSDYVNFTELFSLHHVTLIYRGNFEERARNSVLGKCLKIAVKILAILPVVSEKYNALKF